MAMARGLLRLRLSPDMAMVAEATPTDLPRDFLDTMADTDMVAMDMAEPGYGYGGRSYTYRSPQGLSGYYGGYGYGSYGYGKRSAEAEPGYGYGGYGAVAYHGYGGYGYGSYGYGKRSAEPGYGYGSGYSFVHQSRPYYHGSYGYNINHSYGK